MTKKPEKQEASPLKVVREFLDMTQTQFGFLLGGVDGTTVSRRERNNSAALSWDEILNLDEALADKGKRFKDFKQPSPKDNKKDA